MSPERSLSRGERRRIQEIKKEIRSQVDLTGTDPNKLWQEMEEELSFKLPGFASYTANGYAIIRDWFDTRLKFLRLEPEKQQQEIRAFQERYPSEQLLAVRDALRIITQTMR